MTERRPADDIRGDEPSDVEQIDLGPEERTDPDFEPQPGEDLAAEPGTDDPDLEAARVRAPTRDPKAVTTDQLRPEEDVIEYEAPYEPTPETASGVTAAEERAGETLDDRIEQEEPEEAP
jgi:hypothetical protein